MEKIHLGLQMISVKDLTPNDIIGEHMEKEHYERLRPGASRMPIWPSKNGLTTACSERSVS